MKGFWKFCLALGVAFVVMLAVRGLGFQVCSIEGDALLPHFHAGDRVLVNRWSYGLRTGDGRLFPYGRLARQDVQRNDLVALEDTRGGQLLIGCCKGLPGDTVTIEGSLLGDTTDLALVVPSLKNCDRENCYYIERIGIVPEHLLIGRATLVLYSHHPKAPLTSGYRRDRLLLTK
jgi:signal peptidase I